MSEVESSSEDESGEKAKKGKEDLSAVKEDFAMWAQKLVGTESKVYESLERKLLSKMKIHKSK